MTKLAYATPPMVPGVLNFGKRMTDEHLDTVEELVNSIKDVVGSQLSSNQNLLVEFYLGDIDISMSSDEYVVMTRMFILGLRIPFTAQVIARYLAGFGSSRLHQVIVYDKNVYKKLVEEKNEMGKFQIWNLNNPFLHLNNVLFKENEETI